MDEVTFIIKTFERPYCVKRLVKSIFQKYPDAKILIADDSAQTCKEYFKNKYPNKDITVYELEEDQGLSFGRNYLVDRVNTDYFVLLDDDFVFDSKTDIEKGLSIFKEKNLDILGGYIRNYVMRDGIVSLIKLTIQNIIKYNKPANYLGKFKYSENDKILYIERIKNQFPNYIETDIVLNFFIAKTEVIRNYNRWDDELKLQEHTAFFYKAKKNGLRVGFSNVFSVQHKPMRVNQYGEYRNRDYTQVFMRKYDIYKIISKYDDGSIVITENENC